jgi:hypothetical protein
LSRSKGQWGRSEILNSVAISGCTSIFDDSCDPNRLDRLQPVSLYLQPPWHLLGLLVHYLRRALLGVLDNCKLLIRERQYDTAADGISMSISMCKQTWSYILLKTGLWRLMRLVYKLVWDICSELQEPLGAEEEGRGIGITTPPRGGVKWALPMSPDITPKRPAGKINRDHDETDERQEVIQTSHGYLGALGLIMEDDDDPFLVRSQPRQTRTRVGSRPTAGDGSRRRSLGAQVDRLKRRAQSEPLY